MPLTPAQILAGNLCDLIAGLTKHRHGRGPHWIQVETVARELRKAGIGIPEDDLQAAIALCVERHVMKAEGRPVHSVAVWQKDWQL